MAEKRKFEFFTKSQLKQDRGWTDLLIETFLPVPHEIRENPNYRKGPPMCLYKIVIVEEIEKTPDFQVQFEKAKKRKKSAEKAVKTKLKALKEDVKKMQFRVPKLSAQKLKRRAIDHYNYMQLEREAEGYKNFGEQIDESVDKAFLDRIEVNYLRHQLTKYEEKLDDISGRVGFFDGYCEIRKKIFTSISQVYPWLATECKRQQGD